MIIDENTSLRDILDKKGISAVFKKYGLYCLSCKGMVQDRVRNVIMNNGLNAPSFIADLNNPAE